MKFMPPYITDKVNEAKARQLYIKEMSNHPKIHCNRFPSWEELDEETQRQWKLMIRL